MVKFALIADDLTGAADSGVQFAKRGLSTALLMDSGSISDAEVVIVDTESRADLPKIARAKVHTAISALPPVEFIYKKIDSTLRGNIGTELEAIMEARGVERAVLAPAFPSAGRITVGGRQLLDGQPLEETVFAQDPLCPIADSYIPALLDQQMQREVGLIELALVRKGVDSLAAAMQDRGEAVLVVDATTEEDLHAIARSALRAGLAHLTCGSAGLADAMAEEVVREGIVPASPKTIEFAPVDAPVLVVAGSRNPLTGRQLSRAAQEMGLVVLRMDTEELAATTGACPSGRESLVAQAGEHISAGRNVALSLLGSPYVEGLSFTLARALGEMAARLAGRHKLA
ncbi:MAG: four-carbon acid sugar kinase family protein, partial [Chloroflexota bacterium]|nr:four-carbon acid sugar kinase family protein [Chloroflexota bacterium]